MATILEASNLKKYFPFRQAIWGRDAGWVRAVDGVSFRIEEGETFALVGESGCGKTTVAKTVLLLERPTAGRVLFRGKDLSRLAAGERRQFRSAVQAVFQDPYSSLNPRMRTGSIVAEPLEVNTALGKRQIRECVEEVLAQVGLDPRAAELFPHEFSGGQRQRIAVARSLIVRPSLVVLDEPVSALDVSIGAQIMNLLKDLQARLGVAYLLIAHNLAAVRYMSHRVGVMYLGRMAEQASTDSVFARRFHPYTEALFTAALPSHPDLVREEIILSGEVPSALHVPPGCRFHPRCPSARPVCSSTEPEWRELAPGHYAACHFPGGL